MHETNIDRGSDSEPATARDETLDTFHQLVKTSVAADDVEKWVRASTIRQDLFDDLAVGTIRWRRSSFSQRPRCGTRAVAPTTAWPFSSGPAISRRSTRTA
jgi:hypothetical protein